jgi:hypothetical protein
MPAADPKPKTYEVRIVGRLPGVSAKDIILALIARIGVGGGTGHVFEYTGEAIRALTMEQRMTICNMSIEGGARAGMIAPDDTTLPISRAANTPQGAEWDKAVAYWRSAAQRRRRDLRQDHHPRRRRARTDDHLWHQSRHGHEASAGHIPDADERRTLTRKPRLTRHCATWACSRVNRCSAKKWMWSSSAVAPTRASPTCVWRRCCSKAAK